MEEEDGFNEICCIMSKEFDGFSEYSILSLFLPHLRHQLNLLFEKCNLF
jgi:hypothetical protein